MEAMKVIRFEERSIISRWPFWASMICSLPWSPVWARSCSPARASCSAWRPVWVARSLMSAPDWRRPALFMRREARFCSREALALL